MSKIIEVEVTDLRVPTSDTLQGSDPFHKKPNYSCVLTGIRTEDGLVGLSVNFSAGAGNDWLALESVICPSLFWDGTWHNSSRILVISTACSSTTTNSAGWQTG